jgi:hypothetical protein
MRRSPLRACLLAAALTAPLASAAEREEPARWVGEHPLLTVRAHDVQRSLHRFAQSPYADLQETPWGALLAGRLRDAISGGGVDADALAASIDRVALGIDLDAEQSPDIRWAVATGGDVEPMRRLCRGLAGTPGTSIEELGRLFAFRGGGRPERGEAPDAHFADACVELSLDPARLGAALGLAPPDAHTARPLSVGLSLDRLGLRERWDIPTARAHADAWQDLRLPSARRELLSTLPATTLAACTFSTDGTSAVQALACSGLVDCPVALLAADLALARIGMPPLIEVLGGLRGDTVAWIEAGSPFPSLTLVAGMEEDLARRILPMLALQAGLRRAATGGPLIGFLGQCPVQADYRDGNLVITTHPDGIDGVALRRGGFLDDPEAKAALAEIPEQALVVGISRSGPLVAEIARLALAPLAHLGMPQLSTLPHDLEARAHHGYFALTRGPDGLNIDSGGLLGGPCATYAALGGAAFAAYVSVAQRLEALRGQVDESRQLRPTTDGAHSM